MQGAPERRRMLILKVPFNQADAALVADAPRCEE